MDVTFTNVLEGARQYFQGLPTAGSGSALSPAYSTEAAPPPGGGTAGMPQPSSNVYWPPRAADAAPRDHAPTHNRHASSHNPDSSRPPSSSSSSRLAQHYAQNVSSDQNRALYPGAYQENYQNVSMSNQHLHHSQQQQLQQQQQHQQQQQQHQQHQQHQYQQQQQQQRRQLQQQQQQQSQQEQQFQFSRPHARETPTSYPQYQSHISTSSPYQQSQAPYQVPSPQQPRAPSREQIVPRVPSREQSIPRVPSREQLVPAASPREQQYSQSAEYHQARSYYPQTSQSKSSSYPPASQPAYSALSQQNKYYKHIYAPQQSHQSVYAGSRREEQSGPVRISATDSVTRTTHNLPPIAAISNYHSSRGSRESARPAATSTTSRTKAPGAAASYIPSSAPVTSGSIIQQNPAAAASTYQDYRSYSSQSYQRPQTTTAQSYTNVIVTATTTPSYYNASQGQASSRPYHQSLADPNASGRVPVKRESPLDLSVKTVRTPADSTLSDADHDGRNKLLHQGNRPGRSLASHSYPQVNMNSFQRNLAPTATAPKVEFRPNFNVPSLNQPRRPPEKAHSSNDNRPVDKNPPPPRHPALSVPTSAHANSYGQTSTKTAYQSTTSPLDELRKKRTAEAQLVSPPNKVAKVGDALWQSIDLQIEERFSSYKQQQAKLSSKAASPVVNGAYQEHPKEQAYSGYQKQNYGSVSQHSGYNQYQAQTSHTQTYVPTPASHQYPGYAFSSQQPSNSYNQSSSRSFSGSSNTTTHISKNSAGGAVDKRVLSLLRNSLEVKGQKKLEQQKSNENSTQYPRTDVQHPSTDVTAPLQPKPGFIGRNNVSPFTPTSFPENSNLASMYKLQMPKAVDSINFATNKSDHVVDKQTMDTVITIPNHNNNVSSDYDGLAAAFLAARIRTKGELKQGGPNTQSLSNSEDFMESQLTSPIKQDTSSNCCSSSGSTTVSNSPVKVQKERPRKRLFSRNEEDPHNFAVPPRDKSGLRSSSETSVFDFPDSDSENDAGKESLEAMRKGRKTSKQSTPVMDVKGESPPPLPRSASPSEDIFTKLCDNFVEQLKSGGVVLKKTIKKKRGIEPTVLASLESATRKQPLEEAVQIKVEVLEEEEGTENKTDVIDDLPKEEPMDEAEPETKIDLTTRIENDLISQDDNKDEDPVFVSKKLNVRRRLVSSSDSSDNETETNVQDKQQEEKSEQSNVVEEQSNVENNETEMTQKISEILPIVQPTRKPSFGDGSDFYPGWEEGVFKYKKSLRMPPALIQVSRPPQFHRLSTSLPDLDPCPHSPTASLPADDKESKENKSKLKKVKSEMLDSDNESNSSFNILFGKKTNYDSEGSLSIRSLPNTAKEMSIIDKLLEKCGGRKRKKYKRKDDHSPKVIPKTENPLELLPTPSLEIKEERGKETKKLSSSPIIKAQSPLLGFRKSTINTFKDAFVKRSNNIPGVNEFTTVVMNSRTRRETRVQKQRATIKEVFGEDRPASAPPVTCVNDMQMQIKEEATDENCPNNLVVKLEEGYGLKKEENYGTKLADDTKSRKKDDSLFKAIVEKKIKTEIEEDSLVEDDTRSLDNLTIKSETVSLDGDNDSNVSGKKRGKFGKMRRKLSSGFDYIRKKKKVKKEAAENDGGEKKKRKNVVTKTLESVDDIQKEIKTWVLNKGIGETHLHRAARSGLTDVTAYCLEKMESNPSPKDNAGYTPLHWACSKGHLDIAKLLLLYGANPSESAQGGIRPLHEAVENGFVEIARLLLSYGADPTLATYSGMTPLALTNDEVTKDFLKNHLNDIEGEPSSCWTSFGPASVLDPVDDIGFDPLDNVPEADPPSDDETDVEFEMSEQLLPNLYTLRSEPPEERWVLLQDLSGLLKIKSRDALLKQLATSPTTSGGATFAPKAVLRELKMSDFLEQARCCQFLNAGEKINTRASKIALVKYTDKVKELLKVESVVIEAR